MINGIFDGVPHNFTYCNKYFEKNSKILEEINNKNCTINDCSKDWKIKQKKFISKKNICVYECNEDDIYFYEYKGNCDDNCPEKTHKAKFNNFLCILTILESDCLFKEKKTEECIETVNFKDLIEKEYIPLNKKDSIDKVFVLFQKEIKNKDNNIFKNEEKIFEGENMIFQITTAEEQEYFLM